MRPGRQLGFLWGGSVLAAMMLSPWAELIALGLPTCPWKRLLGIPCLSCGSGRAALALARFEFSEALIAYPLPTLAWTVFIVGGLLAGAGALLGRGVPSPPGRLSGWMWAWFAALVLANWAYLIATGA